MISETLRTAIRPTSLLMRMIWAGEFFSFCIYYFVVQQAAARPGSATASTASILAIIFGAMGVVSVLGGIVVCRYVFSQRRAQGFLAKQIPPSRDGVQDSPIEDEFLVALLKQSFLPYIIGLGMINSCILFGMVRSITLQDPATFIPFAASSVVGALLCFPRPESFIEDSMLTWQQSFRRRHS